MYALIDPSTATGRVKALLDATQTQLGRVPNLYRAMAQSPTGLAAYLDFRGALQDGELDQPMRERITLLTAQLNDCDYCVAAHSFRGQKIGLTEKDLQDTRLGMAESPKIHAAMSFIKELIDGHGVVPEPTKAALVTQGWTQAEMGEMVAHVALNVFSNYFKHLANPALDFPAAPALP